MLHENVEINVLALDFAPTYDLLNRSFLTSH